MPPRAKAQPRVNKPDGPIFTLPPYKVESVFSTFSETIDWGLKLMKIPKLHRLTKGAGIRIAVLDTGVAMAHPDLKGAIKKTRDITRSKSGVGDSQGHGTHCAGVIAARDNAVGVVGVAPESELLIGKVLGDSGYGSVRQVIDGIKWAVDNGAQIISMSLGAPENDERLERAIDDALAAGCFIIAAAGNEGPDMDTIGYPAMYANVVSVGAIDQNKKIARFSSRGTRVDIVAPGVDILSCYPPRGLAKLSGTSMATPFVAGVVALMLSRKNHGIKTPRDLIDLLRASAVDAGPDGYDPAYGFGLIDPTALLTSEATVKTYAGYKFTLSPDDLSESGKKKVTDIFGHLCDVRVS